MLRCEDAPGGGDGVVRSGVGFDPGCQMVLRRRCGEVHTGHAGSAFDVVALLVTGDRSVAGQNALNHHVLRLVMRADHGPLAMCIRHAIDDPVIGVTELVIDQVQAQGISESHIEVRALAMEQASLERDLMQRIVSFAFGAVQVYLAEIGGRVTFLILLEPDVSERKMIGFDCSGTFYMDTLIAIVLDHPSLKQIPFPVVDMQPHVMVMSDLVVSKGITVDRTRGAGSIAELDAGVVVPDLVMGES